MDMESFQNKYSDLYDAIFEKGVSKGGKNQEELVTGATEGLKAEAAAAERDRIKSVEDQLMVGHEVLIEELKWDGKTTGEQAAIAVLRAEKELRVQISNDLNTDAIDAVAVDAVVIEDSKEKDFMALVMDYKKTTDCSHGQALVHIARNNPDEHTSWIASINKGGE